MKKFISSILAVSMLMPVMSVSTTTLEAQSVLDTIVEENNEMLDVIRKYKTEKIGVECTEENCSINCEPINDTYVYAEITLNGVDCDAVRVVKRSADGIWLQELGDLERVVYGNGNIYTAVELFEQDKLTFEEFKKAGGAYYCDINGNDIVDVNDVTQLQLFLSQGKADEEDELATMYYDVTLEGYIDVSDVTKIQMYLAGYEDIPCYGHNVVTQGYKEPTCSSKGYTGDRYCEDCQKVVSKGNDIIEDKTNHKNTEIRNAKEVTTTDDGYTGDTYCKDCNTLLSEGKTIAKLPSASSTADLKKYEQYIFDKINEEREAAGLDPLEYDEELYPAVKIRAAEFNEWTLGDLDASQAHMRPNGKPWNDVMDEMGISYRMAGENLLICSYIEDIVPGWMNSPPHRSIMLTPEFTNVGLALKEGKYRDGQDVYYISAIFRIK